MLVAVRAETIDMFAGVEAVIIENVEMTISALKEKLLILC